MDNETGVMAESRVRANNRSIFKSGAHALEEAITVKRCRPITSISPLLGEFYLRRTRVSREG